MSRPIFVSSAVSISITDPWQLASENGETIRGVVVEYAEIPSATFLITLNSPISQEKRSATKVVAKLRHMGVDPGTLVVGAEIACNFYGVSESYHLSGHIGVENPKDAIVFIGGMKLA